MYNYDFKDEKVLFEKNHCLAEINNKEIFIDVLVTDKNLLLFYNEANDFINMKTQGIFFTPNYELLKKIKLDNLAYECDDKNTYIDKEQIVIYDFCLQSNK